MASAGFVVFVKKSGKASSPYDLEAGEEYTIGSSIDCHIRFKFAHPLLQDVHALLHVNESGVATLTNECSEQTIKINDKPLLRATILKHEDKFDILGKVFQYFNSDLKDVAIAEKKLSQQIIRNCVKQRKSIHPLLTSSHKTSKAPPRKCHKVPSFVTPTKRKISPKCKTESKVLKTVSPPRNAKKRRFSLGTFKTNVRTSPPVLTRNLKLSNSLIITETDELLPSTNSDVVDQTPKAKRTSKVNVTVAVSPLSVPTKCEYSLNSTPKVLGKCRQSYLNTTSNNIDSNQCSFAINAPAEGSPLSIRDSLMLNDLRKRISLSASTKSYKNSSIVPVTRRRTINIIQEKEVSPTLKNSVLKIQPRRSIRSTNVTLNNIGKDSPSKSTNKSPRISVQCNLDTIEKQKRRSQRTSNIQEADSSISNLKAFETQNISNKSSQDQNSLNDVGICQEFINEQISESVNKNIKESSLVDPENLQNSYDSSSNLQQNSSSDKICKNLSLNSERSSQVQVNKTTQSINLLEDSKFGGQNTRRSSRNRSGQSLMNESNHDNNGSLKSIQSEGDELKNISLNNNSSILARKSLRFSTNEARKLSSPRIKNEESYNSPKMGKLKNSANDESLKSLVESSFREQVTYETSTKKSLRRSASLNNSQEVLSSSTRKSVRQSYRVKENSSNSLITVESRKSISEQLTETVNNTSPHEKSATETTYVSTKNYLRHSSITADENSENKTGNLFDVLNVSPICEPVRKSLILPLAADTCNISLGSSNSSPMHNETDVSHLATQDNSNSSTYLSSLIQSGESIEDLFDDKNESLRPINEARISIGVPSSSNQEESMNISTRSTRRSVKDDSNYGKDSMLSDIHAAFKQSQKSVAELVNISTSSTRTSVKDDSNYGGDSMLVNITSTSKELLESVVESVNISARSTRSSIKDASNYGGDSMTANISSAFKESPKSAVESVNISTRSTRKSVKDVSNYGGDSMAANISSAFKESPKSAVESVNISTRSTRKSVKDFSNYGGDSMTTNISSVFKESPKSAVESVNLSKRSTRKSVKDVSNYGGDFMIAEISTTFKDSPTTAIESVNISTRSARNCVKDVSNYRGDSKIVNLNSTFKESPKSAVESVNIPTKSTRRSMKGVSNYGCDSTIASKNSTFKESPKLSQSEPKRNSNLINDTWKRNSTIDSQEETLNLNISRSKANDREHVRVSIFDESTEVMPSPVQRISSRRSLRSLNNRDLKSNNTDQSSIRDKFNDENESSLNSVNVNHDDNSVISVSSQSFSSFKKNEENNDTEGENDVISLSFTPNGKNNTRFNRTSVKKERVSATSRTPVTKTSLFDDVLCTSTPFCKPSTSSSLNSKKSELESSSKDVNIISISSESSLSINTGASGKRTSLRKRSVSHGDKCISCQQHSIGSAASSTFSNKASSKKSPSSSRSSSTPVQQRASRTMNISKTPSHSFGLEDETPKSAIKSKRLSSKSNTSVYQPLTEDITPVTPQKLMISELNEEAFKTPINTPGLFETIKENVIRSRKRHRDTNDSFVKERKRTKMNTPTKSEFARKEKTLKSPNNDLTKIPNLRPLMSPKVQKTPNNDLRDVAGVKRIFKKNSPLNDLRDIPNLKNLQPHTPKNDLTDVIGVKRIFQKNSPKNDLTNVPNLKNLVQSKRNTPKNDLRNIPNLRKFVSPKSQRSPRNNLANVSGVANIFNVSGVEALCHGSSDIENSEDLFSKLTGQKPLRSYKGKSLSPTKCLPQKVNTRKTMGDIPVSSPRVEEWVNEQTRMMHDNKQIDENLLSNLSEKLRPTKKSKSVSPARSTSHTNSRRKIHEDGNKSVSNKSRRRSEPPQLIPLKHSRVRTSTKSSVTPDRLTQMEKIVSAKQRKSTPKKRSIQGDNEISAKKIKLDDKKTPTKMEESDENTKDDSSESANSKVNPVKSVRFTVDQKESTTVETPVKKNGRTRKQKRVYESPVLDQKLIDASDKSNKQSPPTKKPRKTVRKNMKSDYLLAVEDVKGSTPIVQTPTKRGRKTAKKETKLEDTEPAQLSQENQSAIPAEGSTLIVNLEQVALPDGTENEEAVVKRNTRTRRRDLNDEIKQNPAVTGAAKLPEQDMKHSTPIGQTPVKRGRKKKEIKKDESIELSKPTRTRSGRKINEEIPNDDNENKGRRNLRKPVGEADSKQDTIDVNNAKTIVKRAGRKGKKVDEQTNEASTTATEDTQEAKTKRGRKAKVVEDRNESRGKRVAKQNEKSEDQEPEEGETPHPKKSTRSRRGKDDEVETVEKITKTRSRSTKRPEKNDEPEIKKPVTRRGKKQNNDEQSVEKNTSEAEKFNTESTNTRSLRRRK